MLSSFGMQRAVLAINRAVPTYQTKLSTGYNIIKQKFMVLCKSFYWYIFFNYFLLIYIKFAIVSRSRMNSSCNLSVVYMERSSNTFAVGTAGCRNRLDTARERCDNALRGKPSNGCSMGRCAYDEI